MLKSRGAQIGFSLACGLCGLYVCGQAFILGTGELSSPSIGFMPMIAGALMIVLAGAAVAGDLIRPVVVDRQEFPNFTVPVLSVVALVLATYLLEQIGFIATAFLLVLLMTRFAGRISWLGSLVSGAASAGTCYVLFEVALGVRLP